MLRPAAKNSDRNEHQQLENQQQQHRQQFVTRAGERADHAMHHQLGHRRGKARNGRGFCHSLCQSARRGLGAAILQQPEDHRQAGQIARAADAMNLAFQASPQVRQRAIDPLFRAFF